MPRVGPFRIEPFDPGGDIQTCVRRDIRDLLRESPSPGEDQP
jgi:hypothetical protein